MRCRSTPTKVDSTYAALFRENRVLHAEIDSLKTNQRVASGERAELQGEFGILIRAACANAFMSRRDKYLVGLTDDQGKCIR
jgi:hypothetical protein